MTYQIAFFITWLLRHELLGDIHYEDVTEAENPETDPRFLRDNRLFSLQRNNYDKAAGWRCSIRSGSVINKRKVMHAIIKIIICHKLSL